LLCIASVPEALQRFGELAVADEDTDRVTHARLRIGAGVVTISDPRPARPC